MLAGFILLGAIVSGGFQAIPTSPVTLRNSAKAGECVLSREPITARAMITAQVPKNTFRSIANRFVKVMNGCGLEGHTVRPVVVKGGVAERLLQDNESELLRSALANAASADDLVAAGGEALYLP
jgi:hypothetical protein